MIIFKRIASLLLLTFLASCGGGGGNAGTSPFGSGAGNGTSGGTTTTGSSGTASVTVSISSISVTSGAPATVTASVKDASGTALGGKVVAFTSTGGLGTFSPSSALTDSSGNAIVKLAPASPTANGADSATATVTLNGSPLVGTSGFQVVPASGTVGTPSVALALSTSTVTSTTPSTVTASVKDANGAPVFGQVVTFAAPGNLGSFTPASALTDANGNAVAKLTPSLPTSIGGDRAVATVAFNGTTLNASLGFEVAIANADLILTTSTPQIANSGSATALVTVRAIDSSRNTVAGVPVSISADAGAVLSGATGRTDANGTVTATLSIGADRSNRLITITSSSGSVTRTATIQVFGTTVTSSLVPSVVARSTAGSVLYRVTDQVGNPLADQPVQVVAPGIVPSPSNGRKTGTNGDFAFNYTSPSADGSYKITASIAGQTDSQTLVVQSASAVPDATGPINSSSISANPSVVAVNLAGSEVNRSEIRVLFLGASNLPIPRVRAQFDLNGDPNSIGGKFTTGTTTLFSDANGLVTTAYVPSTRSSPTDGLTVRVCYALSDAGLVGCPNFKVVTLTVTAEPLGVSIGTNEQIIVNTLTYVKQFVITVSDAAGVAKPDVNLVASLDLPQYRKGYYAVVGAKWVKQGPLPSEGDFAICANEDKNRNGVLEDGEDRNDPTNNGNGDGQLWPRKPDVIVSLLQSRTGADGTAVLQIQYAKDHGSWVDALITVSASGVSGSEGRAQYSVAPVPVDAASINNVNADPAFKVSPYGVASVCSNPN